MNKYNMRHFFFLLHNTTHHSQVFVPNFRILTQVVAEKSLTEKKVYRQTLLQKWQKLYTPYILRIGGNLRLQCIFTFTRILTTLLLIYILVSFKGKSLYSFIKFHPCILKLQTILG